GEEVLGLLDSLRPHEPLRDGPTAAPPYQEGGRRAGDRSRHGDERADHRTVEQSREHRHEEPWDRREQDLQGLDGEQHERAPRAGVANPTLDPLPLEIRREHESQHRDRAQDGDGGQNQTDARTAPPAPRRARGFCSGFLPRGWDHSGELYASARGPGSRNFLRDTGPPRRGFDISPEAVTAASFILCGMNDPFGARSTLKVGGRSYEIHRLDAHARAGLPIERLPYSLKILIENLLRTLDGRVVRAEDVEAVARWNPAAEPDREIAFTPSRVLLQDFTGVPAVVDLAAMRDAMATLGGDPKKINPLQPAELVIDHSVQVDE